MSTSTLPSTAGPMLHDLSAGRMAVNASWLLRLRWVAVAGQLVTVGFVLLILRVGLPLTPVLLVVAFTAVTNVGFALWLRIAATRRRELLPWLADHRLLGMVMTADLLALTVLLYFAGGPSNPFTLFYFVNLALAAVVLPSRWAWPLTGIAVLCFLALFFDHVELPALAGSRPMAFRGIAGGDLEQLGLLVAFSTCASVIVYFITRVTGELRRREVELRTAEQQQARSVRLEALATLAAGTAHELASPLSTIAVVVKELTKHLQGADVPRTVIDDVRLIRSELDRCRTVLDSMAGTAGQAVGEEVRHLSDDELVEEILGGLRNEDRNRIRVQRDGSKHVMVAPLRGLAQALRGLVQNALDASEPDGTVQIQITGSDDRFHLSVVDRGHGMSTETLSRAGEPFFTTKEPGQGMGLGLFLARSVIERLGGTLRFESAAGRSTTALVELPALEPARLDGAEDSAGPGADGGTV